VCSSIENQRLISCPCPLGAHSADRKWRANGLVHLYASAAGQSASVAYSGTTPEL
jgi:hypothetical protein